MGNVHPKELKNLLLKENLELAISSINDDSHTTLNNVNKEQHKIAEERPKYSSSSSIMVEKKTYDDDLFDENIQEKKNGPKVNIRTGVSYSALK